MYEVFNGFLSTDTWHTGHDFDIQRFNQALGKVVSKEDFSPDTMGDHMRRMKGVTDRSGNDQLALTIDKLVDRAWAVREYLRDTKTSYTLDNI
jgi:hypothetical protein